MTETSLLWMNSRIRGRRNFSFSQNPHDKPELHVHIFGMSLLTREHMPVCLHIFLVYYGIYPKMSLQFLINVRCLMLCDGKYVGLLVYSRKMKFGTGEKIIHKKKLIKVCFLPGTIVRVGLMTLFFFSMRDEKPLVVKQKAIPTAA